MIVTIQLGCWSSVTPELRDFIRQSGETLERLWGEAGISRMASVNYIPGLALRDHSWWTWGPSGVLATKSGLALCSASILSTVLLF